MSPPSAVAWPITAAGTLALDDLSTPAGAARDEPGGSAAYFALAAADPGPVHVVAALGADGAAAGAALLRPGLDLTGVVRLPGHTYRWRAVHDPATGAVTGDEQRLGVYRTWWPAVPAAAAAAPLCFVGSMAPGHQLSVLRQCRRARLRAADTMVDFIDADRAAVRAVLAAVDVAFLNERELLALAADPGAAPLAVARELLGRGRTRAVVWTRGPLGAVLVTAREVVARPAVSPRAVIDPTGAGDALAGGFCAELARRRRAGPADLAAALDCGLAAAARSISAFGLRGLCGPGAREGGGRPAGGPPGS